MSKLEKERNDKQLDKQLQKRKNTRRRMQESLNMSCDKVDHITAKKSDTSVLVRNSKIASVACLALQLQDTRGSNASQDHTQKRPGACKHHAWRPCRACLWAIKAAQTTIPVTSMTCKNCSLRPSGSQDYLYKLENFGWSKSRRTAARYL